MLNGVQLKPVVSLLGFFANPAPVLVRDFFCFSRKWLNFSRKKFAFFCQIYFDRNRDRNAKILRSEADGYTPYT